MTVAKETVRCPFCREVIASGATRCKHCHADLSEKRQKRSLLARYNTFRVGFLGGVLFTLILIVLIYYQFYAGN
jgi:hypothetical protein